MFQPRKKKGKGLSRVRAMRAMCWECMGGSREECMGVDCPLYAWYPYGKKDAHIWFLNPMSDWKNKGRPQKDSNAYPPRLAGLLGVFITDSNS